VSHHCVCTGARQRADIGPPHPHPCPLIVLSVANRRSAGELRGERFAGDGRLITATGSSHSYTYDYTTTLPGCTAPDAQPALRLSSCPDRGPLLVRT